MFPFKLQALAAGVLAALAAYPALGVPARFWISIDETNPGTHSVPVVAAAVDTPRRFHIWAQPRTRFVAGHNAATNPFMTFDNVSLNIVSPQSTFIIDSTTIEVANPIYSTTRPRFEYVGDSSTGLAETTGAAPGVWDDLPTGFARGVLDLQGFTFMPPAADGFGIACDSSDTACGITISGAPAWRFASFTVTPTSSSGTVEFYLQVGRNGMTDVGTTATPFRVEFGLDTLGAAPLTYNPDVNRQVTLTDDDPDLVLNLAGPGDYNADGFVDSDDYDLWRVQFGTAQYDADGNGDGRVDAADYSVWRDNAPFPGALLGPTHSAIPEPKAITIAIALFLTSLAIRRTDYAQLFLTSSGG